MTYYIEYNKQGIPIPCSKSKYYKVKREVLTTSNKIIAIYESKSKNYRHLVIL